MTSSTASNPASSSGGRGTGSAAITWSQVVSSRSCRSSGAAAVNRATRSGANSLPRCLRASSTAPCTPPSRWCTSAASASCITRTDIGTASVATPRGTPLPSQRANVQESASPTPGARSTRSEISFVSAQWAVNRSSTVRPFAAIIAAACPARSPAPRPDPALRSACIITASCEGPTWYMPDRNATSSPNICASSNDSPVQTVASSVTQYVSVRCASLRPMCSASRTAIRQARRTCSIGCPSPKSDENERAAISSESRTLGDCAVTGLPRTISGSIVSPVRCDRCKPTLPLLQHLERSGRSLHGNQALDHAGPHPIAFHDIETEGG